MPSEMVSSVSVKSKSCILTSGLGALAWGLGPEITKYQAFTQSTLTHYTHTHITHNVHTHTSYTDYTQRTYITHNVHFTNTQRTHTA